MMNHPITTLAAGNSIGGAEIFVIVVCLAITILVIAGGWKMFEKAGQPGWAIIIPIYNMVIMLKLAGRPLWWVVLMFIPIVSIVIMIIMYIDVAKNFGKGVLFGLGLAIFGIIFIPVLGFGDAQYNPVGAVEG